jgi:protein TonB
MKRNTKSGLWMQRRMLCAVAVAALALGAFAHPVENKVVEPVFGAAAQEVPFNAVEDSVYMDADELPAFPGGDMALAEWLRANLKYPEKCKKEGASGRVIVRFVVNKNGRVAEVEAIKSPHPELAKAAVRTVKKMPKWTPGKKDGQTVRCAMNLPIMYKWNK